MGYEVMIDGMYGGMDGSRQGRAHIQRMLMSVGGISGRLLAMFLETQDDGGSASLSSVTTNGGIKVTYEVMIDPNDLQPPLATRPRPRPRPLPISSEEVDPPILIHDPYYPTVDGSEE